MTLLEEMKALSDAIKAYEKAGYEMEKLVNKGDVAFFSYTEVYGKATAKLKELYCTYGKLMMENDGRYIKWVKDE